MKTLNKALVISMVVFMALPAFVRAEAIRHGEDGQDRQAVSGDNGDVSQSNDNGKEDGDVEKDHNTGTSSESDKEDNKDRIGTSSKEARDDQNENEDINNATGTKEELKSDEALEHRSAVADFVHELLDVADRQALGGIGDQVREIAKQQNESEIKISPMLDKIEGRGRIMSFLFGADFGAIKEVKNEIADSQKRLDDLERIKENIATSTDKVKLENQINSLRDNIQKVLDSVQTEEARPSLLGWLIRLFSR